MPEKDDNDWKGKVALLIGAAILLMLFASVCSHSCPPGSHWDGNQSCCADDGTNVCIDECWPDFYDASCPSKCPCTQTPGTCVCGCGDGSCDPDLGEDCNTCPGDCGVCPVVIPPTPCTGNGLPCPVLPETCCSGSCTNAHCCAPGETWNATANCCMTAAGYCSCYGSGSPCPTGDPTPCCGGLSCTTPLDPHCCPGGTNWNTIENCCMTAAGQCVCMGERASCTAADPPCCTAFPCTTPGDPHCCRPGTYWNTTNSCCANLTTNICACRLYGDTCATAGECCSNNCAPDIEGTPSHHCCPTSTNWNSTAACCMDATGTCIGIGDWNWYCLGGALDLSICNNDGTCDAGEYCGFCADCDPCCGNGVCDGTETPATCPADCASSSCISLGTSGCSLPADCCSGTCDGGTCCLQSGSPGCTGNSECCLNSCVGGTCCLPAPQPCTINADCCSGTCGNLFGNPVCCKATGDSCTSGGECCTSDCNGNCCIAIGSGLTCSATSDCCQGICSGGTCCKTGGSTCTVGSECCSGSCPSGTCCSAAGETCTVGADCCSGNCQDDGTGTLRCCANTGETCTSTPECCGTDSCDIYGTGKCIGCLALNKSCNDNSECCSSHCDFFASDWVCCSDVGEACSILTAPPEPSIWLSTDNAPSTSLAASLPGGGTDPCCDGYYCDVGGTDQCSTCKSLGASCTSGHNYECCGDLGCSNNKCCVPSGKSGCTTAADCCWSGDPCIGGVCAVPCKTANQFCGWISGTWYGACCSGLECCTIFGSQCVPAESCCHTSGNWCNPNAGAGPPFGDCCQTYGTLHCNYFSPGHYRCETP